jgi:hypothetical protein
VICSVIVFAYSHSLVRFKANREKKILISSFLFAKSPEKKICGSFFFFFFVSLRVGI